MGLVDREPIILASQSPRRQELLSQIGCKFDLLSIEIDESVKLKEAPLAYVTRMAREKAQMALISPELKDLDNYSGRAILTADTSVVLGEQILGKPADLEIAKTMLLSLSGKTHQVITCVAVANTNGIHVLSSTTKVTFCQLTEHQVNSYCQLAEGIGKAGAYAIQGHGALFISSIEGSYSGVMGLPLYETGLLLDSHFEQRC